MNRIPLALIGLLLLASVAFALAEKVSLIEIDGAIGPATATYIARAIEEAARQDAQCLIIQLDTPGGLLDSTKVIVQSLLAARVPTVVYVAPSGASAASAGCFITLAAHLAAMAPATNIGAAHPVQMGGAGQQLDDAMKKKLASFASSYIESIAVKRARNVEWARSAVQESASISETKALELKVIDLIAVDREDLLRKLDGQKVEGATLRTASAEVVRIPMTLRERVFQMIWRPEVLFVLMLIAIYGIIGELSNPGAIIPGAMGVAALILALYMAAVLPINVAGVALIVVAIILFIAEAFTPTFGLLTLAGIITFFIGSLMLFDRPEPAFRLSLSFIIPATLLTAAFFVFMVSAGLRAQFLPARSGREMMIGRTAPALTVIDSSGGKVFIEGERWNAVSDTPIEKGEPVEIVGAEGLTLKVKPKSKQ